MLDLKHPTGEQLFPRGKSFVDSLKKSFGGFILL